MHCPPQILVDELGPIIEEYLGNKPTKAKTNLLALISTNVLGE
jgi:hypothetical protein